LLSPRTAPRLRPCRCRARFRAGYLTNLAKGVKCKPRRKPGHEKARIAQNCRDAWSSGHY
jgi:hypothetical protein